MNYLHRFLVFDTVEQGEKNLDEAIKIRNSMGGAMYYNIVNDDCIEIYRKLQTLKQQNIVTNK